MSGVHFCHNEPSSTKSVIRFSRLKRVISLLYLLAWAWCFAVNVSMPKTASPANITAPKIVMLI